VSVKDNLDKVRQRISDSAIKSGRSPEDIQLIAASKTKSVQFIKEAFFAKQRAFGENRIQEALKKMDLLKDTPDIEWHLIGNLQKNKVKYCPGNFSWIHSIDSLELVEKLEARCTFKKNIINLLIQVNLSHEDSKFGLREWDDILHVAEIIYSAKWLHLRGLMTIPDPNLGEKKTRKIFEKIREWRDELKEKFDSTKISELSMGMSSDYDWAIQEGATMIRIGTAIFGSRD